jgi:hypothetical protein
MLQRTSLAIPANCQIDFQARIRCGAARAGGFLRVSPEA